MSTSPRDLILVRSDDGGWSLHTPKQIAEAREHDEAPGVLHSGTSEMGTDGKWRRPDLADYLAACMVADGAVGR